MEAILDTNFIITCIKEGIDFIDQLKVNGFRIIVPKEVVDEIKDLRKDGSRSDRQSALIALEIIEHSKLEKTSLTKRSVDEGLIERGKKGAYIATLDAAIRRIVPNKIIISRTKKSIEIERE